MPHPLDHRIPPFDTPQILIRRADWADTSLSLPEYATPGAAGADLRADLRGGFRLLAPGERALVPTGLHMQIPDGFEVQIRARSGLALRHGIGLVNGIGTIDSDYRGEVGVLVINLGTEPFTLRHGERVAQIVVAPVVRAGFAVGEIAETARGEGGFGSTGRG